eukprot:952805-Pelagomonas_calceolata.AAC.3
MDSKCWHLEVCTHECEWDLGTEGFDPLTERKKKETQEERAGSGKGRKETQEGNTLDPAKQRKETQQRNTTRMHSIRQVATSYVNALKLDGMLGADHFVLALDRIEAVFVYEFSWIQEARWNT